MPKIKGEIVCMLTDDQVLALAGESKWWEINNIFKIIILNRPSAFTNLPKRRNNCDKRDGPYVDPDLLPSCSESGEEDNYDGDGEEESGVENRKDA